MKILAGGLSNIPGFSTLAKNIGIKESADDFAILYSETVCAAAAVYTSNQIKGAPLYVTMEHLLDHQAQAIVVNSGIANVATGEQGIAAAKETAALAARELRVATGDVLVASTGVIGRRLPMAKIKRGITGARAELGPQGDFAGAIMTTDTHRKEICVAGAGFKIAGVAKGSGMIAPNMATMLSFIITDADIPSGQLNDSLKAAVDQSFNMVSVDMDTSTSDMLIVMANGAAKNVDPASFQEALDIVCVELARMIAADGEGATKLIVADVSGARDVASARRIAKAIVGSNLVKTAVYGHDPNWGRLLMAIGNSGAGGIVPAKIGIRINTEPIVEAGAAAGGLDEKKLSGILADNQEITIAVDMGMGQSSATAYGCDMSEEYIKINALYTT